MTRTFTGRHMAAILVVFFGIVIAVNFTMAGYASSTFGGIVVENSYVASQEFNTWLDEAAVEKNLGWEATATRLPDNQVKIVLAGAPANATLSAEARHPLGRLPDRRLSFTEKGEGQFTSSERLPKGRWTLRIEAHADGHSWRKEQVLQ